MKKELAEPLRSLKKISDELKLSFETQDWGIINGSANRINEFINYFDVRRNFSNNLVNKELFELIISSFNEAILQGKFTDDNKLLLVEFVTQNRGNPLYEMVLDYWASIENAEEMPISIYLKNIVTK